jgi:hypothetical protein
VDLAAGSYKVTIDDGDGDIPSSVAFGGTSVTTTVVVATGAAVTVNFPFDVVS